MGIPAWRPGMPRLTLGCVVKRLRRKYRLLRVGVEGWEGGSSTVQGECGMLNAEWGMGDAEGGRGAGEVGRAHWVCHRGAAKA